MLFISYIHSVGDYEKYLGHKSQHSGKRTFYQIHLIRMLFSKTYSFVRSLIVYMINKPIVGNKLLICMNYMPLFIAGLLSHTLNPAVGTLALYVHFLHRHYTLLIFISSWQGLLERSSVKMQVVFCIDIAYTCVQVPKRSYVYTHEKLFCFNLNIYT